MDVALPSPRAHPLAGAFVVPGTDPGPRRRVLRAGKDAHVGPQLRHDHGGHAADPGDLLQDLPLRAAGLQGLVDPRVEAGDISIGTVQPAQLHLQQEAMVLVEPALERLFQVGALFRSRPCANAAIAAGVAPPSRRACSMRRPETPTTFEATLASLMFAVSSTS
jgi:hypothetical protein